MSAASPLASKSKRKASGATAAASSTAQNGTASSATKRTRLVGADTRDANGDDDEEVAGDLDIAEQDRKRLQQGRKGRIMTDGYDSDDSEEDSDEKDDESDDGAQRGSEDKGVADEDEDMFNLETGTGGAIDGVSDDEDTAKPKAAKGKAKYLELKDIEGQEFSGQETEEKDAELELESDEEGGEEEEVELHDPDAVVQPLRKSKKKPQRGDIDDMGFQIDSFNMKNEMTTGRFDEEGNYIANAKDPHAEHDKWLSGNYSKKGIEAARAAKARREREARRRDQERDNANLDEDECKMRLAGLLHRGETVLAALQRFGAQSKNAQAATRRTASAKEGKAAAPTADDGEGHKEARAFQVQLDQITSLTSELMSRHGIVNIYDESYENLVRDVRKSGLVRSTWDPAGQYDDGEGRASASSKAQHLMYVYRWSPAYLKAMAQDETATQEQQTFGPFGVSDLQAWKQSGYFGDAGERIVLRAQDDDKGSQRDTWRSWSDVFE